MQSAPWRATVVSEGLDEIQSACLQRLLLEAGWQKGSSPANPADDKTELDRMIDSGQPLGCDSSVQSTPLPPTTSELLWSGDLDGTLEACINDQGCQSQQPVQGTTLASSSNLAASDQTVPDTGISGASEATGSQPTAASRPNKRNWNKWEPDPNDHNQLDLRRQKDMKNLREMRRKLARGLHT